jgi:hypothetical protein
VVTGAAKGIGRAIGLAGFDLEGTEVVGRLAAVNAKFDTGFPPTGDAVTTGALPPRGREAEPPARR